MVLIAAPIGSSDAERSLRLTNVTYKDKDRAKLSSEKKSKLNFMYANAKLVLTDVGLSQKRPAIAIDPIALPVPNARARQEDEEGED